MGLPPVALRVMKVFPTCLFSPSDIHADFERRTTSGGVSLSGEEDIIATDGGGRVFLEIGDAYLDEPIIALAWRAFDAWCDGGVRPVIVHLCEHRYQPSNGVVTVPHGDGTTFSDETEYSQGDAHGEVAVDAPLRATTLTLTNLVLARPLVGGEWFAIDHPTWRWRSYRIAEVMEQDATSATITFRAPLREAVTAGTEVDFTDPRCVMRVEGGLPSPTSFGFVNAPAVRFVEDFTGSYE